MSAESFDYAESDRLALWNALNQARAQLAQTLRDAESATLEASRLKERARKLEQECELQRTSVDSSAANFRMFQEIQAQLQERCSAQPSELARLRTELAQTRKRLAEAQARPVLPPPPAPAPTLSYDDRALNARANQLDRHEERLRLYAESLRREKNEIREVARQLGEQLQTARNAHPLQDYLTLTEFELSKIEVQLKKTPTSAPERPALEQTLEELVVQRNFLRSVIDASRAQLARQAEALTRLTQGEDLAAVPPPPPKPRASSGA